jgi:hypothetical protein
MGHVIFFEGPIGVGKTSLGRVVAETLGHGFIDGDDHSEPGPRYASSLTTSRGIVKACRIALKASPHVIVAYPLRCINWVYFQGHFARHRLGCISVSLTADIYNICARERRLSPEEAIRSAEMIAQGYGARPFSAVQMRTDTAPLEQTAQDLAQRLHSLLSETVR